MGYSGRESLHSLVLVRRVRLPPELSVREYLKPDVLLHPEGVQDGLVLDGAQLLERQATGLVRLPRHQQRFRPNQAPHVVRAVRHCDASC